MISPLEPHRSAGSGIPFATSSMAHVEDSLFQLIFTVNGALPCGCFGVLGGIDFHYLGYTCKGEHHMLDGPGSWPDDDVARAHQRSVDDLHNNRFSDSNTYRHPPSRLCSVFYDVTAVMAMEQLAANQFIRPGWRCGAYRAFAHVTAGDHVDLG